MSGPNLDAYEVPVVELDHKLTVIVVDHANRRMTAWSLIDGEWTEANVAEAVHEGRIPWTALRCRAFPSCRRYPTTSGHQAAAADRPPGTADLTKRHYNSKMNEGTRRVGATAPRFLADAPRQLKTQDAWTRFAHELATALQGLEEDEWLVLSLKKRNRFAQFMNQGGAGYRAETVSDFYLEGRRRLSESDRATLLDLGWEAPTNLPDEFGYRPDGSPNYFVDLANPVPLHELAALAVATLVNVHGAHTLTALQYSTGGSDNRSIRFPNLGIRRSSNS